MGKLGLALALGTAAVTFTVAAVVAGRWVKSRKKWKKVVGILRELDEMCGTPVSRLKQVVDAMAVEMHAGLASEGGSKLIMLLTFVDKLPNGSENGTYYALDLGCANFRVFRVQLGGRRSSILRIDTERHPIQESLLTGTSEDLFELIASHLKNFVEKQEEQDSEPRELGFSFSFPVKQMSVRSGNLIKLTKGFSIQDMVGKDVAACLQEALTKKGLDIHVAALVNDCVGTLAVGHYYDEDTVAAVRIGTGTNACYMERADAVIKCQGIHTNSGGMVINTEWANFWSSHLPRTPYDIDLDAQSPNPNEQGFEKMVSGMYLGEIVRRVLLSMSEVSDIFGPDSSKLSKPFLLRTPQMAAMHEDETPDLREVARILNEVFEMSEVPLKVRKMVVSVCDVVTRRAGRLVGAGIVGILKKTGRDGSSASSRRQEKPRRTVVAVEGGVYTNYRVFREYLQEAVADILGDKLAPYLVLQGVQDGSATGAALLAASNSAASTELQ
ncbi:hypothetical protein V2J09_006203 [Rumex salicifolius]